MFYAWEPLVPEQGVPLSTAKQDPKPKGKRTTERGGEEGRKRGEGEQGKGRRGKGRKRRKKKRKEGTGSERRWRAATLSCWESRSV